MLVIDRDITAAHDIHNAVDQRHYLVSLALIEEVAVIRPHHFDEECCGKRREHEVTIRREAQVCRRSELVEKRRAVLDRRVNASLEEQVALGDSAVDGMLEAERMQNEPGVREYADMSAKSASCQRGGPIRTYNGSRCVLYTQLGSLMSDSVLKRWFHSW